MPGDDEIESVTVSMCWLSDVLNKVVALQQLRHDVFLCAACVSSCTSSCTLKSPLQPEELTVDERQAAVVVVRK